jgi:protein-histidine pros-kinase
VEGFAVLALYEALRAHIPDALFVTDADGRIVHWNEGAESLLGHSTADARGRTLLGLAVSPDRADEHLRIVAATRADGQARAEAVLRCSDGSFIHADVVSTQLEALGPGCILWSARDITPLKGRRGASQLQARFGGLLDSMPDGVLAMEESGRILLANRHLGEMFGYDPDELRGQPVATLLPSRFRRNHAARINGYFNEPRTRAMGSDVELYGLKKTGEEFPVDISLSPLRTDEGLVAIAAVRDITNRQRASRKFKDLLEAAPDAIVIIDRHGKIVIANSQADAMFGHARSELIGQDLEFLVPGRYRATHAVQRARYFAEPRVRAMGAGVALFGLHRDGSEFPVEISLSPLETESGTLAIAAIRDIRERRRMESELKERNSQLKRVNESKVRFLASMSHELRAPLNAIIGFTGTLLMKMAGPLNGEQEHQMQIVRSAAEHLLALINDLLDITRIDSGHAKIRPEPVSCRQVATEVTDQVRPMTESKGLTLRLELPKIDRVIRTDARALRQVLLNLLSNAVKYTDRGGIDFKVSDASGPQAGEVRFSVRDTGIGISAGDQKRLFRAFSQLGEEEGTARPGAGLGLFLSARLAALLGGRIALESKPGVGSVFTLVLPQG